MEDSATHGEIRLEERRVGYGRRAAAGLAVLLLAWGIADFIGFVLAGQPAGARTLILLILGCLFLLESLLRSDAAWTFANNEIRIDRKRLFRRTRTEIVRADEISEIRVLNDPDGGGASFSVEFKLASGDLLTSPPIPDVTRVYEISTRIARELGFDDVGAAATRSVEATRSARGPGTTRQMLPVGENANPGIYLGSPTSPFQGWTTRIITLLIAGLFGFPFLLKIWNGEPLSTGELVALSFELIAVCVFLRYAHLLGRTFWTIRHGEIRIERIQLNGKPHVDTIVGRDIARIAVVQHSGEEVWFTITIWLQSGRRLTSSANPRPSSGTCAGS